MSRTFKIITATLLSGSTLSGTAYAQSAPATAPADEQVAADAPAAPSTDIIVTGTRSIGTKAADSAAPIQLLSQDAIEHVGQPNLNKSLTLWSWSTASAATATRSSR